MRNEQEFKALVMQKVHQQQDQKRRRLQKIRAVTATLSAVALVICGVAAVTLFIRANPTVDFGAQDGPYGGGNRFFFLFNRGTAEEEAGWDNSASIEDTEGDDYFYSTDIGKGDTALGDDADVPGEEMSGSVGSAVGGTTSDSPQSTDKNSNGAEGSANTEKDLTGSEQNESTGSSAAYPNSGGADGVTDAEEDLPNCGGSAESDQPNAETGSDAPEESVKVYLYLEEIHPEKAALKLSGGRTEDLDAIAPIVSELESIFTKASATEKTGDAVLFALRFENGYTEGTYRFCEGNIMTLIIKDKTESYLVKSTDYLRLLHLLQQTEFTTTE